MNISIWDFSIEFENYKNPRIPNIRRPIPKNKETINQGLIEKMKINEKMSVITPIDNKHIDSISVVKKVFLDVL